jgi:hypothetical protein
MARRRCAREPTRQPTRSYQERRSPAAIHARARQHLRRPAIADDRPAPGLSLSCQRRVVDHSSPTLGRSDLRRALSPILSGGPSTAAASRRAAPCRCGAPTAATPAAATPQPRGTLPVRRPNRSGVPPGGTPNRGGTRRGMFAEATAGESPAATFPGTGQEPGEAGLASIPRAEVPDGCRWCRSARQSVHRRFPQTTARGPESAGSATPAPVDYRVASARGDEFGGPRQARARCSWAGQEPRSPSCRVPGRGFT